MIITNKNHIALTTISILSILSILIFLLIFCINRIEPSGQLPFIYYLYILSGAILLFFVIFSNANRNTFERFFSSKDKNINKKHYLIIDFVSTIISIGVGVLVELFVNKDIIKIVFGMDMATEYFVSAPIMVGIITYAIFSFTFENIFIFQEKKALCIILSFLIYLSITIGTIGLAANLIIILLLPVYLIMIDVLRNVPNIVFYLIATLITLVFFIVFKNKYLVSFKEKIKEE